MPAFACMTLPALACFLASSVSETVAVVGGAVPWFDVDVIAVGYG